MQLLLLGERSPPERLRINVLDTIHKQAFYLPWTVLGLKAPRMCVHSPSFEVVALAAILSWKRW